MITKTEVVFSVVSFMRRVSYQTYDLCTLYCAENRSRIPCRNFEVTRVTSNLRSMYIVLCREQRYALRVPNKHLHSLMPAH